MIILFFICFSFFVYFVFKRRSDSILETPNLKSLLFYRDYLLLTMLPYLYYWFGDYYKSHYILGQLDSNIYFTIAAASASLFLVVFMFSYSVFFPALRGVTIRVNAEVSYRRLIAILSLLSFVFFIAVTVVSYRLNTGIFALFKGIDYEAVGVTRHYLSQGGGLLTFNKIFMKAWVPMLAYLFFYIYLIERDKFKTINKFSVFLSFAAGCIAALFFLEKAVFFIYLFGFLGIYVYSGGRLRKHYLPLAFFGGLLLLGGMYILTYGDRILNISYLRDIILHRAASQSVGSVMSFDYFSHHDFKGMAGVSNLWAAALGESFSSPYSDMIKYYDSGNADISGAMSSFVTGEAYGLFGLPGIVISGVLVAFFLSFFEATRYSKILAIVFVGVYGLYFSHHYVASSFFGFVWPVGLAYDIFPFVLIMAICVRPKKKIIYV